MDNRPTRSWIPQALAAGSLQYFWSHVALPLIVTIGAPVVTGWIAWVQERNWLYVVLAAQLSFALGPFGLVWFEVWRARRRVEDKLAIEVGKPGREIEVVRGKHCIKVIQSTLTITNKALCPISYVIDDIDTRVVGHAHVYQDARVANRSGIVPAESSYEYKDISQSQFPVEYKINDSTSQWGSLRAMDALGMRSIRLRPSGALSS